VKPRLLLLTTDQEIGRAVSEAIVRAIPDATVETRAVTATTDLLFANYDLVFTASDQLELLLDESRSRATEEADFAHEQLLGILFHELRTPLTPILAWAQLLRRTNDPARIEMGGEVIERNARTQMSLIDEVLDINRLGRHSLTLDIRHHDLGTLIQETAPPIAATATEKGVQLMLALAPPNTLTARVDGARIKQIVAYLVSNAVRFTPSGGSVTVSSAREADFGIVAVLDTGAPIEQADLPFVFDPFRTQSMIRNQGMVGVQLALARGLAELQGGTLEAANSGVGAEFKLRVPLATPAAESDPF
jgi:signal transduction histidine kinase